MTKASLSLEDLRDFVDADKVLDILKLFDGKPNIQALTTLSCCIGILLGAEAKNPSQILSLITATHFIVNDACQLSIKEGSPLVGLRQTEAPSTETVN
jgi:hypothetical protein